MRNGVLSVEKKSSSSSLKRREKIRSRQETIRVQKRQGERYLDQEGGHVTITRKKIPPYYGDEGTGKGQ